MADKSKISWCDATWQVVAGCSPASPGCKNCYSARLLATRHRHLPWAQGLATFDDSGEGERRAHWTGKVVCRRDQLSWPFSKRRPLTIFVGDRGDLFHHAVPESHIANVMLTASLAERHTFLFLTKRPARLRALLTDTWTDTKSFGNLWFGVSIEDQQRADNRVPVLLDTPAAHRFLSIEPMLGPIDLSAYFGGPYAALPGDAVVQSHNAGIDWVIVGGESGPGARVCWREWIDSIVRQCAAAHVPCFVKQLGANQRYDFGTCHPFPRQRSGADPSEWPEALRVRQTPWGTP
jgi:protein gp37